MPIPARRCSRPLRDRIAADDAAGAQAGARISNALLTRSYPAAARRVGCRRGCRRPRWQTCCRRQPANGRARRPYFEVLFVNSQPAARWPALAAELRRLRRPEDAFVYEPVFVGSFEDAFCAAAVNPAIAAVVIAEGFPYRSRHDAPVLRSMLDPLGETGESRRLGAAPGPGAEADPARSSTSICSRTATSRHSPATRRPSRCAASSTRSRSCSSCTSPILEGVAARYETPFFDNLKKYAQRPIGTFHALPIARGKSVFKSDWIRDMGEFYGINLFLAESSATTGGLDSLLEPTGNIKRAQDMAARAFGADHVFFVTNGTSTSNKMAVQALLGARRHRHRRPQLPQVAPLRHGAERRAAALCRGVPDDGILDVRRGAARRRSSRRCSPCGPKAGSTGCGCWT